MKKFLSKYKFTIIINLLIFVSYIFISSAVDIFGIDDILANSYGKGLGFIGTIKHIFDRAYKWNIRVGEILYFIVGAAPRWVYFFVNGLMVNLFFNLTFVFVFGSKSKEYFNTKNYFITLISNYILSLTLFPGYSEVFIWMAGAFNHMWDVVILLLAAIPFRLLFDGFNIFSKNKKLLIMYYIFCFLTGFSVENAVPWLIVYMFIITAITFIKKKLNKFQIISLIIVCIAFGIMTIFNSTTIRIKFFSEASWSGNSFYNMIQCLKSEYIYMHIYLIILTTLLLVMIFLKKDKEQLKNLGLNFIQLLVSTVSLVVIHFSPYFAPRTTTLFFFFLMTYNTYLLSALIKQKIISILVIIIELILLFSLTIRYRFFYDDFNYFNKLRLNYIMETYNEAKDYYIDNKLFICPRYDNKYNYINYQRLVKYEDFYCDHTYLKYLFDLEDDAEYISINPSLEETKLR